MRIARSIICVCLLIVTSIVAHGQTSEEVDQGFMNGQAVIKFQDWVPLSHQRQILKENGLEVLYFYPVIKGFFVSFDKSISVDSMVARFSNMRDVKWAQANNLGKRTQTFPNDPNFGQSYALHNTGQNIGGSSGTNDADMDVPEAWDLITDASNVIIAIVDSGCRRSHQDLNANIWVNAGEIAGNGIDDDGNGKIDDINGWDFLGNDNNPSDQDGHGTNVAGCIGMVGDNGVGSTGVCWQAQMMILKDGDTFPQVALSAAAIEYAAMNGAISCNFSTGYGGGSYPVLQAAVNVAQTAGMIICVAAGNSSTNLNTTSDFPATYTNDNLIVVAATDNDDNLTNFSSFGNVHVDVAAAGLDVYTTSRFSNSSYGLVSGTSFSAPLTTGVVGLIRAYNPGASYQSVRTALINTSDPVGSLSGMVAANGRINLFAALNLIGPGGGASTPTPDPMTFLTPPAVLNSTSITMTATPATPAPVEYKFTLTASTGTGGSSSPWMTSATYVQTGLQPASSYTYTVKARNANTLVETQPSAPATANTNAVEPGSVSFSVIKNTSATISSIGSNGNPSTTDIAIRLGFTYIGPGGTIQFIPYWQPLSAWDGFKINDLTPQTAYSIRAVSRSQLGATPLFGPETGFETPLLPPSAEGVVADQTGPAEQIMTINGSNGGPDRVIALSVGDSYSLQVANPSTMSIPANFAIVAWFGVPSDAWELTIPAPYGRGTLCFTPCDVNPGLPTFNLVSTFGSTCGEYTSTFGQLATWTTPFQSFPFPLPELTLQVFVEEAPGVFAVGNALVFRYF